jgi:hypothetical protein
MYGMKLRKSSGIWGCGGEKGEEKGKRKWRLTNCNRRDLCYFAYFFIRLHDSFYPCHGELRLDLDALTRS